MSDFEIDANLDCLSDDVAELATNAEDAGFDGIWSHETSHDAFLPLPIVAEHTTELEFGTRIALAFTRSPMELAYKAWDLARYSDGRFILGLGTQVRAHNERRFSVEWSAPNPRLREVIESLRHIWDVFQNGSRLDYEGEHYSFSLMTDAFNPGPIDNPDIPIYIAGVNEHNIRTAGELCDGLCMHSFNTPSYTEDVILPLVEEGVERGDRSLSDVDLSAKPFVITGDTEEALEERREEVRRRIAFYGSTPSYKDVLDHHGWLDVGRELHALSKEQKWEEMGELITDEMLHAFAIEAPVEDLNGEIEKQYDGVADRVVVSDLDPDQWERLFDS